MGDEYLYNPIRAVETNSISVQRAFISWVILIMSVLDLPDLDPKSTSWGFVMLTMLKKTV